MGIKQTEAQTRQQNNFDLSINRYREVAYEEIEYEDPKVILGKIEELEGEILDGSKDLKNV